MTPEERGRLLTTLARCKTGDLKSFFVAYDLGHAFENDQNRYDSRPKKIADAIDVAERRDGDDRVLRAAVDEFGLGDLLATYVSPGLPELIEELVQHPDWSNVQRALASAAAQVHTDPAGAITASRTAIESVCKHICDERGIVYKNSDDMSALYKKTVQALSISPGQRDDAAIRQILQGAVTVVAGIAALRNAFGDAHGKGKGVPDTPGAYGMLAVNMAAGVTRLLLHAHRR